MTRIRYLLFPLSREIDERMASVDVLRGRIKQQKEHTQQIIDSATQHGMVRNLIATVSRQQRSIRRIT